MESDHPRKVCPRAVGWISMDFRKNRTAAVYWPNR